MGNLDATFQLARCYEHGWGIEKDFQKSLEIRRKAADLGHLKSIVSYAQYLFPENPDDAILMFRKAADLGDEDAMFQLALVFERSGPSQNLQTAFEFYAKAANMGQSHAIHKLATFYFYGIYVEKNEESGVSLFQQAINLLNPSAKFELAQIYLENQKWFHPSLAFQYFKELADDQFIESFYFVAACYESGIGSERSLEQAAYYYEKAAEFEHVEAWFKFGFFLLKGKGITKDVERGILYLQKAAFANYSLAKHYYGVSLIKGKYIKQDTKTGRNWVEDSSNSNNLISSLYLSTLRTTQRFD